MPMAKSLYQDEAFANYWNDRAGEAGEVYKRYVLDPLMFKLVGDFEDKTIIELGCGNGYLAPLLLEQQPEQIIMTDISKYNLQHAAEKCRDPRVSFLEQDATEAWKVEAASIDIVYSNMMLSEIEDIETPIHEAFKALKDGGVFVFSVTHPAWDDLLLGRRTYNIFAPFWPDHEALWPGVNGATKYVVSNETVELPWQRQFNTDVA